MDKGLFLIETHLKTGRPIGELAKTHGVSRGWLYKLLRRYRLEGPAAVAPRSRRPKSSPARIVDLYEDEIVGLRKKLIDGGFDGGAETIRFHMATPGRTVPSTSTIWRVLKAARRAARSSDSIRRKRSTWPPKNRPRPRSNWSASSTASPGTTTSSGLIAGSDAAPPSPRMRPGRR